VLVVWPDQELSATTDIAQRPEYADRRQSRFVGGKEVSGWFLEDLQLAEVKSLNGMVPGRVRRAGPPPPGRGVLTFEELIGIARNGSVKNARVVGLHATVSRSTYFAGLDLAVEPRLASLIRQGGYNSQAAAMFVASAEPEALKALGEQTRARRVRRLGVGEEGVADLIAARLKPLAGRAEVVAPDIELVLDLSNPKAPTILPVLDDAHAAGLGVQVWRAGRPFPPPPFRASDARRFDIALYRAGAEAIAADRAAPLATALDEILPPG
jgi:glycerophosphoryl diester phosphodiesterase